MYPIKKILASLAWMVITTCFTHAQNLFNGGHDDAPFGFTMGYVNKDWRTDLDGQVIHENLWGEQNKRMHGMQIGFIYQPCLPIGAGIHTGLFYECYFSVSQKVRDAGYDDFTEHNLYLPIHLQWRLPITQQASISLFGGIGLNWAISGTYNEYYREYVYDGYNLLAAIGLIPNGYYVEGSRIGKYQEYGQGDWPRRLNMQWEFGCNLRYKNFQLGFTYSIGDTNHEFYRNYKTRQDKLAINISYVTKF
ncbi:MAG: hypothetical protein IJT97_01615 [Bacteroidaceae bacterium]|nr:hypothetical protein [Bacteroidaceae bacterium]